MFSKTFVLLTSDLQNLSVASFEPRLPEQLAVVGEDQELQVSCLEPSGLPAPRVYWKDPRGHIISDAGPVRVQDNTLIVGKARINEDAGNYTCVAENLAGETEMEVQVVVSSKSIYSEISPSPHDWVETLDHSSALMTLENFCIWIWMIF